jgi:hypothetical protein
VTVEWFNISEQVPAAGSGERVIWLSGRHKRRGIAWLVVQIPTSQEGTVTMELMLFGVPKTYVLPA